MVCNQRRSEAGAAHFFGLCILVTRISLSGVYSTLPTVSGTSPSRLFQFTNISSPVWYVVMSLLVVRAKFGGGTTIIPLVVAFLEISKTFVETTTYLRRKLSLVSIIVLGRVTCYHILLKFVGAPAFELSFCVKLRAPELQHSTIVAASSSSNCSFHAHGCLPLCHPETLGGEETRKRIRRHIYLEDSASTGLG